MTRRLLAIPDASFGLCITGRRLGIDVVVGEIDLGVTVVDAIGPVVLTSGLVRARFERARCLARFDLEAVAAPWDTLLSSWLPPAMPRT